MQLAHLLAHDVKASAIAAFREAVGETLLEVQALAVREGLFSRAGAEPEQSLIIAAPASAGKSFIGEMAAVHAVQSGRRVLYLLPLKAMAEELYRTLGTRYRALDLDVVVSTRDRCEFDERIGAGSFHVAVLVYEKLASLLAHTPDLLDRVGLIVLDELHMLADKERGARLELLLSKVRRAMRQALPGSLQLLGLSAPCSGLAELGAWLSAHVIIDERRPVELRQGVIHRGRFVYRSSQSEPRYAASAGEPRGEEQIYVDSEDAGGADPREQLRRTVLALAGRGENVLVFLPDKASSLETSRDLAGLLSGKVPPAAWARDEIAATDEGQAQVALRGNLASGVAFHNSDLSAQQREVVERAFREGEIRVLCATSTLAMGVNLPVHNVIIAERWRWRYSRRHGKWVKDELTKAEYDGMSGRAGRLGQTGAGPGFGRSILIAPSRFDEEVWLRGLVEAPLQELPPALLGKPLGDAILDLVACGVCRNEAEVVDFLRETFTGYLRWARLPLQHGFASGVAQTISDLIAHELIHRDESGALAATASGRVCARKGVAARTAVLFIRFLEAAREAVLTPLELLLVCALTPDGGEAHVPLSLPEHRFGDYFARILLRAQELNAEERPLFRWLRDQRGRLSYEQTKAVKKALLLLDWAEQKDGLSIERDHSVWSGTVATAAADFAWLLETLAELCDARAWPSARVHEVLRLSERLRYGVAERLVPLARATHRVLSRTHLGRIAQAGIESEEKLLQADENTLAQAVGHRALLSRIYQIQAARAALRQRSTPPPEAAAPLAGPAGEIVLLPEIAPRRCFVRHGGARVALSPGSFVLLARLALRGAKWTPRDALGRTPGAVRKGLSRLREELRRIHPDARSWIENDGHGGYRLSLCAPCVVIDRDALGKHPLAPVRHLLKAA